MEIVRLRREVEMKTKALRWTLLFACLFALATACGDDKTTGTGNGDAGAGGGNGGGTGGAGGDGGDGGDGGGGGQKVEPRCGDGKLDPGEECDDGNDFDNDGCRHDCRIEGTCEVPYNFRLKAKVEPLFKLRIIPSMTSDMAVHDDFNSCGAGSRSIVMQFTSDEQAGLVRLANFSNTPGSEAFLTFALREECNDPSSELICRLAQAGHPNDVGYIVTDPVLVQGNSTVYLIADVHESVAEDVEFGVAASFKPVLLEDEACKIDPLDKDDVCYTGLECGEDEVCKPNEPPVITDAVAYRDPEDDRLIIRVDGTDVPGNAWLMEVVALNASGIPLDIGQDIFDEVIVDEGQILNVVFPAKPIMGKKTFTAEKIFNNFNVGLAHSLRLRILDRTIDANDLDFVNITGVTDSEPFVVEIGEIPVLPAGDVCDPARVLNKCMEGLECVRATEGPDAGKIICQEP